MRTFAVYFALGAMFLCLFFMYYAIEKGHVASAVLNGFFAAFNAGLYFWNLKQLSKGND